MRIYKKSNNIIKVCYGDRKIYVIYKDFSLMNNDYFKDVIVYDIIKQPNNYIILTGISYNIGILCFNNINPFLEGCCGIYGLGLNKEYILKFIK